MRKLLFLCFSPILAAQTFQFATSFGGSCAVNNPACGAGDAFPDTVTGIAADSAGNTYLVGTSFGFFPTVNALDHLPYGGIATSTPFVAKIDLTGNKLLYATPIGEAQSNNEQLIPIAITIDTAGNAYITGSAPYGGFPTLAGLTPSTFESEGDDHVFLIKLDPTGKLLLSTQFGGSATDTGNSITLDSSGGIWIAGTTLSGDFPITSGPMLSSSQEIFLARLDPTFATVTYATLLGQGSHPQLALGPSGDLLIAASTASSSWTTTPNAPQSSCAGTICADIIALRFRPSNSQVIYATYLGGSGVDTLGGITADSSGSLYLTGATASNDFPTTPGAFSNQYRCIAGASTCGTKAFVAHINPTGTSLEYSTYFGGSSNDAGQNIAIDSSGNAYVGGQTTSTDFPLLHAIQPTIIAAQCITGYETFYNCGIAGFAAVLNAQGSALLWSGERQPSAETEAEYNGVEAVAVDVSGNVYLAGDDLALESLNLNPPYIPVSACLVKIASAGTPLTFGALTNAASFTPGLPYGGGGLASLFVSGLTGSNSIIVGAGNPLPTILAGVTITVGGALAPLLAVATFNDGSGQINFQVPFNTAGTVIEVDYNGSAIFLQVPYVAPGIFSLSDGTPAIQHATDFSLVDAANPITPGEVIVIYVTGLGEYPGAQNGVPTTGPAQVPAVPAVSIAGTNCSILYAGPTPGYVGLDQINCQTSPQTPAGIQQVQVISPFGNVASISQSNIVSVPVK